MNPYQNFEKDPFEIARLTHMVGASFEAFKKLACAGIKGRKKDLLQDLQEARFTLRRIVNDIEDGAIFQRHSHPLLHVGDIMAMYGHGKSEFHTNALYFFLIAHYQNYEMLNPLQDCLANLDKQINQLEANHE